MTMLLPLQHKDEVRLWYIDTYDNYCMVYEYLSTQYLRKKAGKRLLGWQITNGKIPMGGRVEHRQGIIS